MTAGEHDLEPSSRPWLDPPAQWLDRAAALPGTVTIALTCVVVFGLALTRCAMTQPLGTAGLVETLWNANACAASFRQAGSMELARLWVDHEWWRVLTTGVNHGSWLHLALNTWSLFVVGPWLERAWGTAWLLVAFVVSSVLGCLASVAWAEAPVVVGASAGVLGLAGALLIARQFGDPRTRSVLEPISARSLAVMLSVLVVVGFVVPMIAQAGHVGGLAAGCVLAWGRARRHSPLHRWGSVLVLGILTLWLGATARHPVHRPGYHEFVGYRHLARDEPEQAVAAFELTLALRNDDPVVQNAVAYGLARAGHRLDRAERLVRAALRAEPDNPDYLDTLGWVLCRKGEWERGLEVLERAVARLEVANAEIEGHFERCHLVAVEAGSKG